MPPPPPPNSSYLLTPPLINSGDCNIMLTAVLSLLLVILFVILLHVYAKWFIFQSRRTNPSSSSSSSGVSLPHFFGSRFHHFHNYTTNTPPAPPPSNSNFQIKGLESSVLSTIPLFTYKSDSKSVLECVVCLSAFEDGEVGRKLRNCGHQFHVECLDMWLHSHSTCPICREEVICEEGKLQAIENKEEAVMEIRVLDITPDSDNENVVVSDSLPSSSSSSLALSIKRMVSKNRVELKVHPSTNETELDA